MSIFETLSKHRWHQRSEFWTRKAKSRNFKSGDQVQSTFLCRLPIEIRHLIYHYATLAYGESVHIACCNKDDNRLAYIPCLAVEQADPRQWEQDYYAADQNWGLNHEACFRAFNMRFENKKVSRFESLLRPTRKSNAMDSFLPMTLTCHQMAEEISREIYSTIAFTIFVYELEPLYRFLHNMHPSSLQHLQTINIHWTTHPPKSVQGSHMARGEHMLKHEQKWELIWKKLATATKLRNLHVKVWDVAVGLPEDMLLEPLRTLQVENFTVHLNWITRCPLSDRAADCTNTFEIVRPPQEEDGIRQERLSHWHSTPRPPCMVGVLANRRREAMKMPWKRRN